MNTELFSTPRAQPRVGPRRPGTLPGANQVSGHSTRGRSHAGCVVASSPSRAVAEAAIIMPTQPLSKMLADHGFQFYNPLMLPLRGAGGGHSPLQLPPLQSQ